MEGFEVTTVEDMLGIAVEAHGSVDIISESIVVAGELMRVLVTGSSGITGSAIAERLSREHEVVGLDLVGGAFTQMIGDITNAALVDSLVSKVDAVVHVAGLHAPHVQTHSREDFFRTNVLGTQLLLDAARQFGVKRFVFTCTTSVYGDAMKSDRAAVWITESVEPHPRDVYDETKLAAEALCREASEPDGLRCVVLRMSRCFPEPPELMAIYRLYRGVDRWDVAEAHHLALCFDGADFAIYNVSSQTPFLPEDMIELLRDAPTVVKRRCPFVTEEFARRGWPMPKSIDRIYVIERARAELGYSPKFNYREYLSQS